MPRVDSRSLSPASALLNLGDLDIPVAKLAPDEVVGNPTGLAVLVRFDQSGDISDNPTEATQDPTIGGRYREGRLGRWFGTSRQDKSGRVPELVAEVSRPFQLIFG